MPAERRNKRCHKATDSHETIDFELGPIPREQRYAAKSADDKKTKRKAAVQIGPQDHHCRWQNNAPRSFQTLHVEYYGKHHRGNVWRSGQINIRERLKSGVKQTRG